jgi:transposase
MTHMTLLTGPERRRRWSADDRGRILEASFTPGAVVADVARRFDVSTSLIYKWRRATGLGSGSSDPDRTAGRRASEHCGERAGGAGDGDLEGASLVIPVPGGVRVWIASGHTDMRKGMPGLALLVQEHFKRDPFAGDVFVFRGRGGSLIKAIWHDGLGLSLYAKRLDRGRFIWPQTTDGVVALTTGQMSYLLEGIDWRNPQATWRPTAAG